MTVEQIKTIEPNPDLVARCKALLVDAESGELQGIVGVVVYDNGISSDFWVQAPKGYDISLISDRIIGCLERIKYQLLSDRYNVEVYDEHSK